MRRRQFVVENAGCSACAERVYAALSPLGLIDGVTIDEDADSATVSMRTGMSVSQEEVNRALAAASEGAGHKYRVQAHSWQASP